MRRCRRRVRLRLRCRILVVVVAALRTSMPVRMEAAPRSINLSEKPGLRAGLFVEPESAYNLKRFFANRFH